MNSASSMKSSFISNPITWPNYHEDLSVEQSLCYQAKSFTICFHFSCLNKTCETYITCMISLYVFNHNADLLYNFFFSTLYLSVCASNLVHLQMINL